MKTKLYLSIERLKRFSRMMGIKLVYFIFPICLALGAALLEGISIVLLIPTIRGIIKMDFNQKQKGNLLREFLIRGTNFCRLRVLL